MDYTLSIACLRGSKPRFFKSLWLTSKNSILQVIHLAGNPSCWFYNLFFYFNIWEIIPKVFAINCESGLTSSKRTIAIICLMPLFSTSAIIQCLNIGLVLTMSRCLIARRSYAHTKTQHKSSWLWRFALGLREQWDILRFF